MSNSVDIIENDSLIQNIQTAHAIQPFSVALLQKIR
jgi:hypothetical protein